MFRCKSVRHQQQQPQQKLINIHCIKQINAAYSLSVRSKWSSSTRLTPRSPLSFFSLWTVGSLKARRSLEKTFVADGQFSECRRNIRSSTSSYRQAAHAVNIIEQHTYDLSFRSGFSLEPGDTRVSLNRRRLRGEWVKGNGGRLTHCIGLLSVQ